MISIEPNTRFGHWTVHHFAGRRGHSTFWLCECDCGELKSINGYTLRTGTSSKCLKCKMKMLQNPTNRARAKKTRLNKRPQGTSALIELIGTYKRNATKRGYGFELSTQEFHALVSANCHYCGAPPSHERKPWNVEYGVLLYNGIDRVDNSKGYIGSNCVTCCEACNRAKLSMSSDQFKNLIRQIFKHWAAKD